MNQVQRYNNPVEIIMSQKDKFNRVASCDDMIFEREAAFAMQYLDNNERLYKTSMQNQQSLMSAVKNISAIGISLNPAQKHAYLVPRDNKVVLDISYMGLLHIATESGSILWAQCKIVHENDTYTSTGIDTAPEHKYNPFSDRGKIVGAYCVAKSHDGSYLTEEMTTEDIYKIRSRSASYKWSASKSPWSTDEPEMFKKTVLKRSFKYWPKTDRLSNAIEYINTDGGEGIDFKSEQKGSSVKDVNPSHETIADIRKALDMIGRDEKSCLDHFAVNVFRRGVECLEDMTADEASKMLSMLKSMADHQAAKQSEDF